MALTKSGPSVQLSKKKEILSNPEISRWYNNLASGSFNTAEVAIRRLYKFCKVSGVDYSALVKLDQKALEDLVQDTVRKLEQEKAAPDYIAGILKAVKSWLKHNGRELERDIKIKDQGVPITLEKEQVPEAIQLNEILAAATVRGKVSISLMAFSGLRPEVLGNVDGTAGLTLGDLPELDISALKFNIVPSMVVVRRELSKVKHQYFSFLNQKGCEYILSYLNERVNSGEKLSKDSPVIRAETNHKRRSVEALGKTVNSYFVCTANICEEVRRAIRRAGYQWRPYVLRAYFDSHLLSAELNGKISFDSRAFFMGHKGSIERQYTLHKLKLPRELMRLMRDQYAKGSEFLTAEQLTAEQLDEKLDNVKVETRKEIEQELKRKYEAEVQTKLLELKEWQNQLIKAILQANIGDETKLNLSKLLNA
jgi:integrase